MARKSLLKRAVSSFTALAIATVAMPVIPAFAETGAITYSFDGYDVEYSVKNEWTDGQSIEIKITNTGDEPILNWAFKYDAEGIIEGLWNASVYDSQKTSYVIKNVGWNYEIAPDASVSFGYTLSDYSGTNPDKFELCAKRVDKTDGYDVQYNITNEWDTGLQGEIVITNTSDEPLEAWELSFDSTFAINNLWNGRIISSEDNHYVVASEMWSNPIAAGASVTVGFTGDKIEETELTINNTKVSVVEISQLEEIQLDIDWTDETDTDGDGLPDVYEKHLLGTDPENIDTDGDGLTDYEEAALTGTDPTKYDSLTEGVSDAEADTDEDGLSNKTELELGTDPIHGDTDGDTLSDGDEINVYGTNPLSIDTDFDGLNDNDEIILGVDPINPDTNGDGIVDGDEIYTVKLNGDNIDKSLYVNNDAIPSLEIYGKGNANNYIYIDEYTGKEQVNELCIGKTVVISGGDAEGGKLTFDINNEKAFDIYDYAEKYGASAAVICYNDGSVTMPLLTDIDSTSKTLSAEYKGIGKYFVVNVPELIKEWDCSIRMLETGEYELGGQADIVFIVDVTGSMGGTIDKVINNISAFAEDVESSGIRSRYALIEYGDITCDGVGSTKVKNNGSSNWYTDTETFKEALKNLGRTGGGDTPECAIDALAMAYNLDMRDSAEKCFVLVTDAGYKIANSFGYASDIQLFNDIAQKEISVAVATSTYYYGTYEKLVDTTDGFCCNIYDDFNKELLKISDFISEKTNNGYWIALNGILPYVVKLKEKPYEGSEIDSDDDTIWDIAEIGDTTTFNVTEFSMKALASAGYDTTDVSLLYPDVTVYKYTSSPVSIDSDGDGILDVDELNWDGIDERYKNLSPLEPDTIETLYPELRLNKPLGKNSMFNPVYLEIDGNNITINATFELYGDYDKKIPLSSSNRNMGVAFMNAVNSYWTGEKIGTKYDFYKGMKINVKTNFRFINGSHLVNYITRPSNAIVVNFLGHCSVASYIRVTSVGFGLYGGLWAAGGDWKTKNYRTINITPCAHYSLENVFGDCTLCPSYQNYVSSYSAYGLNADELFESTCAHEFGHMMGIWDAYGSQTENNNFSIAENLDITDKKLKELFDDELMRDSKVYYADRSERVTANEMEMALQAFCEDAWQYYYQDVDKWFGGQIMSKAIKCPAPIFVKYNNSSKLFDFYYWDRVKKTYIYITSNSSQKFPKGVYTWATGLLS